MNADDNEEILYVIRATVNAVVVAPKKKFNQAVRFKITDEKGHEVMGFQINEGKKRVATATPVDELGAPAAIDGIARWAVSPTGLVTLAPTADGRSCQITYATGPGTCKVTVTGDAKIGEGEQLIHDDIDIETMPPTPPPPSAVGFAVDVSAEVPAVKKQ